MAQGTAAGGELRKVQGCRAGVGRHRWVCRKQAHVQNMAGPGGNRGISSAIPKSQRVANISGGALGPKPLTSNLGFSPLASAECAPASVLRHKAVEGTWEGWLVPGWGRASEPRRGPGLDEEMCVLNASPDQEGPPPTFHPSADLWRT